MKIKSDKMNLKWSRIGAVTLALMALSPPASAAAQLGEISLNESYLSDLDVGASEITGVTELERALEVDSQRALEMRQNYQDLVRKHELNEKYHLNNQQSQSAYAAQSAELAQSVMNEVKSSYLRHRLNQLKSAVIQSSLVQEFKRPLSVLVGLVAILNGKEVNLRISDSARVSAATNVPSQSGRIELKSNWINSQVEMDGKADENSANPSEKYRFSLSRGIPVVGISTGVTYGGSSKSITATLSKQIVDHLTWSLNSTNPIDPLASGATHRGEQSMRLDYGIRF